MAESNPVTPKPAAAIVLLRAGPGDGIEVFMVRRHVRNEFAPDVFVFPGGSVKPADREAERVPGICAPAGAGPTTLGSGFRVAALRECFEEAGVLLAHRGAQPLAIGPDAVARFSAYRAGLQNRALDLARVAAEEGLTLGTDELLHWAHWITPEAFAMRFDTHFFLAEMPPQQEAAADQLETTADCWIAPAEALRQFEAGGFPLVFATIHQLRALAEVETLAQARERFAGPPTAGPPTAGPIPRTIMPRVVERDGANVILLPDEAE